jgi:hypothetical protein
MRRSSFATRTTILLALLSFVCAGLYVFFGGHTAALGYERDKLEESIVRSREREAELMVARANQQNPEYLEERRTELKFVEVNESRRFIDARVPATVVHNAPERASGESL